MWLRKERRASREDDIEVHALRIRDGGWSISSIARHTGYDRKHLVGDQRPGVRARPSPDPFDPFDDCPLRATAEGDPQVATVAKGGPSAVLPATPRIR